jgi:uncharacterized protein (TIGR02001 family)
MICPMRSNRRSLWSFALGIVAAAGTQVACAEGSVGGHVDVTTDYVFRGVSQTLGAPAVQADLHYQTSTGWFAGVWGSTVNLNHGPGATMEFDAYAGRAWPISGPWSARVTAVQYIYPNDTAYLRYDYFELAGSFYYEDRLAFTVSWSPDTSRYSSYGVSRDEPAVAYDLVGQFPLRGPLSATGSVGYYDLSRLFGTGYWYGSAGLAATFDRIQIDLAYFAAEHEATDLFGSAAAGDRWALTVAWRF